MNKLIRAAILALALIAGFSPAFAQAPPPVPALPDAERRTSYVIAATTCICNVNFALYGDSTDYASWVEVYLNGVRVNFNDGTFGWTITSPTGALGSIPRPVTDAVLTFNGAQTGTVQIVGARRPRRTSTFAENRGVAARDLNQVLNDMIAQNRETWDKTNDVTGRALISQPGNTVGLLPLPSLCQGKFLGFDATGLIPTCTSGGAGTGNVVGPASSTVGDVAVFNNTTGTLLADGGTTVRTRLTANADYYVSKGGNDSCNGTVNVRAASGNCSWLTINKALVFISQNVDLNGQNVIVHVQGTTDPSGASTGIYTENLLVPGYVGYNGNGFGQFIVQGENGVATITGASATATILAAIGGNASPVQFKSFTLANANASGIIVEGDDGGFVALNTIAFGSTGAGGIIAEATQVGGRLLFMAGTFTMTAGLSTGTGFYGRSAGEIIFQPGVTVNFAGASTFSNAVADFATNATFDDSGSTWSGTTPTGNSYVLDKNSGGLIVNAALIPGTLGATLTPIAVGNGGMGQITLTNHGVLVGAGASAITQLAAPAVGTVLVGRGASADPAFQASTPTVQLLTSGSGTYNRPANVTWLEIEEVGGGGGGAGSGTTPGAATTGGNTCWNTAGAACTTPVYQAGGGILGSAAGATSAAGGTVSGSASCTDSQPGGTGGPGAIANSQAGGVGGSSRYGGFGQAGWGGANNATAAATNSGSGGGGSGQNATANAGGGGGAGAWCYVILSAPAATYTYAIGAAGSAGTAGTGGNAGAAGAAGKIRVIEHYN